MIQNRQDAAGFHTEVAVAVASETTTKVVRLEDHLDHHF